MDWTLDELNGGTDLPDRLSVRAEYTQLHTLCSKEGESVPSTVLHVVRLAMHRNICIAENASSASNVNELKRTLRDPEQQVKDPKGRVKIADDTLFTES